jgi:hypothetical protein
VGGLESEIETIGDENASIRVKKIVENGNL